MVCRCADENSGSIERPVLSPDEVDSSNDVEDRQSVVQEEIMITDSAASVGDCCFEDDEPDSMADHVSRHHHQYCAFFHSHVMDGPFLCELCGEMFDEWHKFVLHRAEVHDIDDTGEPPDNHLTSALHDMNSTTAVGHDVGQKENRLSEVDVTAVCDICGWVSMKNRALSLPAHMQKHKTDKSAVSSTSNHQRGASEHRFLCQYCAQSFRKNISLAHHILSKHSVDFVVSDPNKQVLRC